MSLQIDLVNSTSSPTVYAYVTGLDLNANNAWLLLRSDGQTLYHPTSPSQPLTPLAEDCAIPLGSPGATRSIRVPRLVGGRIWFSLDKKLTFLLNPGPAVVMPSVTNPSDPNYDIKWGFVEFTYDTTQVFANISYVDFFSIPIAMSLSTASKQVKSVAGTSHDGLDAVAADLLAQHDRDGQGWDKLVIRGADGSALRVLSPNSGMALHPGLLSDYFDALIDQAWTQFRSAPLTIDTQAAAGVVQGRVSSDDDKLRFPATSFARPSSADVWNNSSGPFDVGQVGDEGRALIPRLAAAINRGTILSGGTHPVDLSPEGYYVSERTNHYAR
ncbi:hypothetical protein ANO11243_066630 [Dothideomycetidae sp. 11243]|nr:hypothetical protein ANO11243_066630 [fungal sp. No.11243]